MISLLSAKTSSTPSPFCHFQELLRCVDPLLGSCYPGFGDVGFLRYKIDGFFRADLLTLWIAVAEVADHDSLFVSVVSYSAVVTCFHAPVAAITFVIVD